MKKLVNTVRMVDIGDNAISESKWYAYELVDMSTGSATQVTISHGFGEVPFCFVTNKTPNAVISITATKSNVTVNSSISNTTFDIVMLLP